MTSRDELKALRKELGMTLEAFGEWLADEVNATQDPDLKPVAPYKRQRVSQWETGLFPVPAKVEVVILRRQLEAARQTQEQTPKPKQKPKPRQL